MSTQRKRRGGTTVEHADFTGAMREVTFDTTRKSLVCHDGATAGGWPVPNFSEIQKKTFSAASATGVSSGAIDIDLLIQPPAMTLFLTVTFKSNGNNPGATTANVGHGDVAIKKATSSGLVDLEPDDIINNGIYTIVYNGTVWVMESGAGGGGTLDHLGTLTASSSSQLDFTGLTGTYDTYLFHLVDLTSSGSSITINMRTSDSGVFATGAGTYAHANIANRSGSSAIDNFGSNSTTAMIISAGSSSTINGTGHGTSGVVTLFNPAGTGPYKKVTWDVANYGTGNNIQNIKGAGARWSTNAIDGIRFYPSSGNFAAGKIHAYGVKYS